VRLFGAPAVNPKAYELYLIGRYEFSNFELNKSLDYFRRDIILDPAYAQAYGGIAQSYTRLGLNGAAASEEVFPKARAAALKALSLDPGLADAHTALAWIHYAYDLDWDGAVREYQRALELSPGLCPYFCGKEQARFPDELV
jgi:tetratricopeptide (TPR) repeat protein